MSAVQTDFSNCVINWQVPTFLIVTGASRGLGATIALEFSRKLSNGSIAVLMARDKNRLDFVKNEILRTSVVHSESIAIDLILLDSPSFEHLFSKYAGQKFRQVILVNNAGTLGDVSKTAVSFSSASEIKSYFEANLFSAMFLTTAFLNAFKTAERKIVLNISSLAALQPFKGWSLYCTGKAARDMYFKVLAEEEKDTIILNYAPGPLQTDMLPQILEKALPEIRQYFHEAQLQNQLLTTQYTVERLLDIIDRGRFKSGEHVDVFDMNY